TGSDRTLDLEPRSARDLGQSCGSAQGYQRLRQCSPHSLSRHDDGVRGTPVNEARTSTLITVDELAQLIDAQAHVVLLDVIDEQGAAPEVRPKIPGSLSAQLATDFSGTPTAAAGRRPLPDVSKLQAKAHAWGICDDSTIVVYDNSGGAQASRAWWTLRW